MTPEQFKDYMEEMKRQTKALDQIAIYLEQLAHSGTKSAAEICRIADQDQPRTPPPMSAIHAVGPKGKRE